MCHGRAGRQVGTSDPALSSAFAFFVGHGGLAGVVALWTPHVASPHHHLVACEHILVAIQRTAHPQGVANVGVDVVRVVVVMTACGVELRVHVLVMLVEWRV